MRVRALLRRANIEMERKLTIGNLVLDADAMTAEIDGEEIPVATREFNDSLQTFVISEENFYQGTADG